MPKMECRESREVPISRGEVWQAAAMGVMTSDDVDNNGRLLHMSLENSVPLPPPLPISPFQLQKRPSVARKPLAQLSPLPPSPGTPPPLPSPPKPPPPSAPHVDVTEKVFAKELALLEQENARLKKLVLAQQKLITGFCELTIVTKE